MQRNFVTPINSAFTISLAITGLSFGQNLLVNPGFETAVQGRQSWQFVHSGWSGPSGAIKWADQPSGLDGPWLENSENLTGITTFAEGDNLAYNWTSGNNVPVTFQVIPTVQNQLYTFTGLLGNPEQTSSINNPNGAIVAAYVNDVPIYTRLEGEWGQFTHDFVAQGTTTKISFGFEQGESGSMFIAADDFSVVAAPEPSSLLLGVLGAGMLFRRRRP